MSDVFSKVYERIFTVLKADADFLLVVPQDNCRPTDDPTPRVAGNVLNYNWEQSRWDTKRRRGEGQIRFTAGAVDNKTVAHDIINLVRELCDERTLSGAVAGGAVTIHLFDEAEVGSDLGVNENGLHEYTTAFRVKLIGE